MQWPLEKVSHFSSFKWFEMEMVFVPTIQTEIQCEVHCKC